jgi:hypothetical protein
MSARQKGLTELQGQIIDVLANDYESLEQISGMIDSSVPLSQVKTALWTLIQEEHVACYAPTKTEMKLVTHPERRKLGGYWFALTSKGERLLSVLEAEI